MENESLLVKTDEEAATDLTTLLKKLYNVDQSWQKSPLFIVAESYGGKFAVTVGLSILQAIKAGELKLKLGGTCFFCNLSLVTGFHQEMTQFSAIWCLLVGIALGDTWISPEDFVVSHQNDCRNLRNFIPNL